MFEAVTQGTTAHYSETIGAGGVLPSAETGVVHHGETVAADPIESGSREGKAEILGDFINAGMIPQPDFFQRNSVPRREKFV